MYCGNSPCTEVNFAQTTMTTFPSISTDDAVSLVPNNPAKKDSLGTKVEQCQQIAKQLDHLPNEMLIQILGNINLHDLLLLRLVNSRWQAVIETICRQKRSLAISAKFKQHKRRLFRSLWLQVGDFAWIKLTNDPSFRSANNLFGTLASPKRACYMDQKINALCPLLVRLFPNIERFSIDDHAVSLYNSHSLEILLSRWKQQLSTLSLHIPIHHAPNTDLCSLINAMPRLKQLWLGAYVNICPENLAPTLGRLERIFIESHDSNGHAIAFRHLGPACTHISYSHTNLPVMASFRVDPRLVSQLTHLSLKGDLDLSHLFTLFQHATSLQVLDLETFCGGIIFTDHLVALARLPHLVDLRLGGWEMIMSVLDQTRLKPLRCARVLRVSYLVVYDYYNHIHDIDNLDMDRFWRVLSMLFPALQELYFKNLLPYFNLEPYRDLFSNLQKYEIVND